MDFIADSRPNQEDVLSYIAFPAQAEAFLKQRKEKEENTVTYSIKRIDGEE